jgi:hypothetical protein
VLRIFPPLKVRRLRPGLNPRTWVPEASTLTPRPPKPNALPLHLPLPLPLPLRLPLPLPSYASFLTTSLDGKIKTLNKSCVFFMYFAFSFLCQSNRLPYFRRLHKVDPSRIAVTAAAIGCLPSRTDGDVNGFQAD